jgi:tungstate transport system ATP-binding protein
MSRPTAVRLVGVKRVLGGREVLNIDRLEVPAGQLLAIVGPNGAGKSTLLRVLAMLDPWQAGQVHFHGMELTFPPALHLRRQATMVFQRPILLNSTVRENVAFGLNLRGRASNRLVDELVDTLGLAHLTSQSGRELSGGEMQRVAIARALAIQPSLLLLDEPTAHLDPASVETIEAIILAIKRQQSCTIVLVTQNPHQARRLGDNVGFMLEGRMVELQPVRAFFSRPRDRRTRAFVRGGMTY